MYSDQSKTAGHLCERGGLTKQFEMMIIIIILILKLAGVCVPHTQRLGPLTAVCVEKAFSNR
jgi:hypothetical protein